VILTKNSNFKYLISNLHSFDLHVLNAPLAFILSQDQTLRKEKFVSANAEIKVGNKFQQKFKIVVSTEMEILSISRYILNTNFYNFIICREIKERKFSSQKEPVDFR